jgi:hypothetical protein
MSEGQEKDMKRMLFNQSFFPVLSAGMKKDRYRKQTVILGNHPLSWQQKTIMLTDK